MIKGLNFIILIFISLNIFSQTKNVEFTKESFPNNISQLDEALKDIGDGDYYYNDGIGNIEVAISFYLKANQFNPNNALLNYKIALCYLEVKPVNQAIKHFYIAQELDDRVSSDFNYNLARAYHLSFDFDKAVELYRLYKRSLKPADLTAMSDEIDKKISECENGRVD